MNWYNRFMFFVTIWYNSWYSKVMIVSNKSDYVNGHIVSSVFKESSQMNYFNIILSEFLEKEKSNEYYIIYISNYKFKVL